MSVPQKYYANWDEEFWMVAPTPDRTYEIRRSDWNVGLVGLELDGQGQDQKIKILTNRLNQNLLENADCISQGYSL